MFTLKNGTGKTEWRKKKASTAFANGSFVEIDANGFLSPAAAGTAKLYGIVQKDVVSTDKDYATNAEIPVLLVDDRTLIVGDVTTGSLAQTNVGEYIDLTDASGADASASTTDVLFVEEVLSSTKGVFRVAKRQQLA